jgi:hypothetical protein
MSIDQISGWGIQKIQKFGQKFVTCITVFMSDMGFPLKSNVAGLGEGIGEKKEGTCVEDNDVCDVKMPKNENGGTIQVSPPTDVLSDNTIENKYPEVVKCSNVEEVNTFDDDVMWTCRNPFRKSPCPVESSIAESKYIDTHITRKNDDVALVAVTGDPNEVGNEKKDEDDDNIDVQIDMFGPVKVAVQSSASTVKLESSDSQPMARSSSLNVSLSSSHQPAPAITKRKRGHNMMSGIGKKAWVSS